ncbi:MAG: AbrB/MazE/SpoVT family DNA-binding domain-containing protein [Ideonella sp.]|nr:AbrB/MazE/SpoVT family DNA-binding domain-containing protein [Ideonella sp.]MBE7427094.1 AbrB/MazE/SpoVT family DNA-binding domain-containing protein [Ideonella sp.]MCC7457738.1 AbrB/MazE/SpoVT family DNA-binding domain-containing protein [Nitrospira sp.]
MSSTAVVREKGQVTLPKTLRDRLGIGPGSRLAFSVSPDGSLRAQVLVKGAGALLGLLARPGEAAKSIEQMDGAVTRVVRARARRGR